MRWVGLFLFVIAGGWSFALSQTNKIVQLSEGVYRIGKVTVDQKERAASLGAVVNMTNGPVEYLLVTGAGKLHEAVFRTEASPADLHVAMLLLGAKGAATNLPPAQRAISGDKVWVDVQTQKTNLPVERVVWNVSTTNEMSAGAWIYNGARLIEGTFTAERDGLFVSLITDVDSLMNNPRPGHENDEAWQVNTNRIHTLTTNVTLVFRLREK